MKFVADGMLGKLARWLRMMGHDVKYSTAFDDNGLLVLAKKERRILLTKDLELYQRAVAKGIGAFYVEGRTEAERLAEIAERFGLPLGINLEDSRCPQCNAKLRSVPKGKIAGKVERNTYLHYDEFWLCPRCGQVYWQGAHWGRIRITLQKAEGNLRRKLDA